MTSHRHGAGRASEKLRQTRSRRCCRIRKNACGVVVSEDGMSLEKSTALARRQYWQNVYDSAVANQDATAAAEALRFVKEYDAFVALLEREQR